MRDEAAGRQGINRGALIVATLLLALVVAASTVGMASAASSKTVKGCVSVKTGKIRIISNSGKCKAGERLVILGKPGPRGPAGPEGKRGAPGQPGLVWKGTWNADSAYAANEAVSYEGSSWLAVRGNTNTPPAEGADWTLLAAKGETGTVPEGTSANDPNTLVRRDGAGGFSAGLVSASSLRADTTEGADAASPLLRLRAPLDSTDQPSDRFRVDSGGGLLASGMISYGRIPASGEGDRMMWHPYKGAFRAGGVSDAQWNEFNVGFYSTAMGYNTRANGNFSTATGYNAQAKGHYSTAMGSGVTASGAGSTAAGFSSHAFGQGAVALGSRAGACGDYSVALGFRATTSPGRRGSSEGGCIDGETGFGGSFVFADGSSLVSFAPRADNQFAARAAGGFMFRTGPFDSGENVIGVDGAVGCDLPANSGSFECASSRTLKEGFEAVDGEAVLGGVRDTPVNTWRYKDEKGEVRHMGPFAEDFREAFGLGTDDTTIGAIDIDGVNFAGVKALEDRTSELQERVEKLEEENAALREDQRDLDERLDALEAELEE